MSLRAWLSRIDNTWPDSYYTVAHLALLAKENFERNRVLNIKAENKAGRHLTDNIDVELKYTKIEQNISINSKLFRPIFWK